MAQFHFDPSRYGSLIRAAIPVFDDFEEAIGNAAGAPGPPMPATGPSVLDLGAGGGETARAVLRSLPDARLTLLDRSRGMLDVAARAIPPDRVETAVLGDLTEALPPGPFHLVVSGLAVHHLEAREKQELFQQVHQILCPGGRFVLGDVVVPADDFDAVTPLSPADDHADTVADLCLWLDSAGFAPRVTWTWRDLAVIAGER